MPRMGMERGSLEIIQLSFILVGTKIGSEKNSPATGSGQNDEEFIFFVRVFFVRV